MVSGANTPFPSTPEVNADEKVCDYDLAFWAFMDVDHQRDYKTEQKIFKCFYK